MKSLESDEQTALFQWALIAEKKYPELKLLHHIPNGGKRDKVTAAKLKREGVKAGIPDLFLPVARKKYHGFYIEMKVGKNKPTKKQIEMQQALANQGYAVCNCYSWQEAQLMLQKYLELGRIYEDN